MSGIVALYPVFNVLASLSSTQDLLRSLQNSTQFKNQFQDPVARQFIYKSLPCLIEITTNHQNESIASVAAHLWSGW